MTSRGHIGSEGAAHVADALEAGALDAVGPPNVLLEVAAALVVGVRSGRITADDADRLLNVLLKVSIPESDAHAFAIAAYRCALQAGIRVPDAVCIETAVRASASRISADHVQLRGAAERGVVAIPLAQVPARLV